jgi:DNA invertase Pin-like site-specific DNA recombinase
VIAKLDRLGRNVAFISALMESGADFVCCDNPHANRLMLHMLAAFAEHEREQISQRTKAALAAAKVRGVKLGNPRPLEALDKARAVHVARRPVPEVLNIMRSLEGRG